ncbi:MAG: Arm DNA-binding domain-containing protein, partial [Thermodesulfobacteriota bacterium]|nr:Arm DNA-binding domain-containing protein [Thermodesulfobacteriota bacterium]
MKDNKFKFTNDRLRKLKHNSSTGKRQLYWDTDEKGLAICLTRTGTKSFQFQIWSRTHKKSIVQTLGAYPALSLREAREQAVAKRMQVNAGEDIVSTAKQ